MNYLNTPSGITFTFTLLQLENQAYATSPIATGFASVTRQADDVYIPTSKFPYDNTGFTVYADAEPFTGFDHAQGLLGFRGINPTFAYRNNGANALYTWDGTNSTTIDGNWGARVGSRKTAISFEANNIVRSVNGASAVITNPSLVWPDSGNIGLGNRTGGSTAVGIAHYKQIAMLGETSTANTLIILTDQRPVIIDGVPTITGIFVIHHILEAVAAPLDANSGFSEQTTWQWNRDGSPISGATSTTYTLTANDVGSAITVTQTEINRLGSVSATSE